MYAFRFLCRAARLSLVTAALAAAAAARADDGSTIGIDLNAGLLTGFGADIALPINNYVGVRATGAGYSYSRSNLQYGSSVAWDGKLRIFDAGLLLDIYPFGGSLRLTGGMLKDGTKLTLSASSLNSLTLNGNTYTPGEIGVANGSLSFKNSVPYVGIGAGNLAGTRGFHVVADVGVLLTGKPTVALAATCGSALTTTLCSQLQTDVAAEQTKMQADVNKLSLWPAIRLGLGYSF